MAKNRIGRINEEIQRELASLFRTMKDPRVSSGMVSITGVETTGDLRYCKVYISVFDRESEKQVMQGLRSASGWLRREMGAALQLRYTPELIFTADNSLKRGAHISQMIERLEEGQEDAQL